MGTRAEEDDEHTYQADSSADEVPAIRLEAVDQASPREGQDHEDAAIRCVHAAEVGSAWKVGITP